jgi:uncharacterized protein YraI
MRQIWFKVFLGAIMAACLGGGAFLAPKHVDAYQAAPTPTGVFVTVTYSDPINVRSGPSTVYYPVVGQLAPGDVVPALGISPGREWIQVSYPGGIGWVYGSFVSISGGELRIVEPPPTPTPLATATIDPTLAAAFNVQPTPTRMPTFTPPPPLQVPQFSDESRGRASGATGFFIIGLGLMGGIGLLVSFILRK